MELEQILEENPEDCVVEEIPVYLSHGLDGKSTVFQYPLDSALRPFEPIFGSAGNWSTSEALGTEPDPNENFLRTLTSSSTLEFELGVERSEDNKFFDFERSDPPSQYRHIMTSIKIEPKTNYAVGLLRGRALYLSPVSAIHQFRPSMAHTNATGQIPEPMNAKPAAMGTQKRDKEENGRGSGANAESPEEDEEKWQPLTYHQGYSFESRTLLRQLVDIPLDSENSPTGAATNSLLSFSPRSTHSTLAPNTYFDLLNPPFSVHWKREARLGLSDIRKLATISERVLAVLQTAHICNFGELLEWSSGRTIDLNFEDQNGHSQEDKKNKVRARASAFYEKEYEEEITALTKYGIMVTPGVWVLRSEHSSFANSERSRLARDYLLCLFNSQAFATKRDLVSKTLISNSEAVEMLSQIATKKKDENEGEKKWILKIPADAFFVQAFPVTFQAQIKSWGQTSPQAFLKQLLASPRKASGAAPAPSQKQQTRGSGKTTATTSVSGKTSSSSSSSTNVSSSSSSSIGSAPATSRVLSQEQCVAVYGGTTQDQQFRFFFTDLFKKHGVCSNEFISKKLTERQQDQHAQNLLTEPMSGQEKASLRENVEKMLNELAIKSRSLYFLKKSPNPLANNEIRDFVIKKFQDRPGWKKTDLVNAAKTDLPHLQVQEKDLAPILEELTFYKGTSDAGMYIWKRGDGTLI